MLVIGTKRSSYTKIAACLLGLCCGITDLVAQDKAAPAPSAPAAVSKEAAPATTDAAKVMAVVPAIVPAAVPIKLPFEQRPYKVEVALTFGETPRLNADFQRALMGELKTLVDRNIGGMWDVSITSANWLTPRSRRGVERLTGPQLKDHCKSQEFDKCYPIAVELVGGRFVLNGREWCRESELLSPVITASTLDRRALANEAMRLLQQLFRTVVQIDEGEGTAARIRVRAGDFWSDDPAFSQVAKDSLFIPFMRSYAKDKSLRRVQFVPWCYLSAKKIERSRVACQIDSGVQAKFSSKRRTEWRGLSLKPTLTETQLTILPQRKSAKPLVGYLLAVFMEQPKPEVAKPADPNAAPTTPAKPASNEPVVEAEKPLLLRTDRFGQVTVPVRPDHPLQWAFVRSGRELLTKFPIVPGAEAAMTAQCPDDSVRLDVEGQVALLESDLIDVIAKRAVTVSLIKSRSKKSEWAKVDAGFAELAKLPKIDQFKKQMDEVQFPAIKAAQAKKNRFAEDKIKKLGAKVLEIATFHLDEEKVIELKEEMAELKKIDEIKSENDAAISSGQGVK